MNARMIAPLVGCAILALPAAAAAASPQQLFFGACLDGEARLSSGEATEVGFAGLPETLRERHKVPQTARVWRIAPGHAYLYLFDNSDPRATSKKTCGVAAKGLEVQELTRSLDLRLAGAVDGTPRQSTQWVQAQDGYVVTVTRAENYTVAQVDWMTERDQRHVKKRLKVVAK